MLASLHDFLKIMAEQLVADILEMEGEEESLTPIEMDPVLLMTDAQIKKEVDQLPPMQRVLFEDLKNLLRIKKSNLVHYTFGYCYFDFG